MGNHEPFPVNIYNFAGERDQYLRNALANSWESWIGVEAAEQMRQLGYYSTVIKRYNLKIISLNMQVVRGRWVMILLLTIFRILISAQLHFHSQSIGDSIIHSFILQIVYLLKYNHHLPHLKTPSPVTGTTSSSSTIRLIRATSCPGCANSCTSLRVQGRLCG